MFFQKVKRKVQCTICPHECILQEGKIGICGVRRNIGGKIKNITNGMVSSLAFDPIEKKPLYHFYPGTKILSVGGLGCNLKCNFCQNWEISQACHVDNLNGKIYKTEELIDVAKDDKENIGIAFTYNEPVVNFEFIYKVASKAQKMKLKTVLVSNGYINVAPLELLIGVIDAFNIDLKSFANSFYSEMAGGTLDPVLKSLKTINNYKKHLEITYLVIPNKNDSAENFSEMVHWIHGELNENIVLHLSRYFPRYKQTQPVTPESKLLELYNIAKEKLKYVYIGNSANLVDNNTYCSSCNTVLIKRNGYKVELSNSIIESKCSSCQAEIFIKMP